ncbi:hypothetical protein BS47DRAFT_1364382 [Hydnum rufescens UP504]|uniref:Uncharacterized protein n=1 Tax=Hydnum rufescens UP504 TaxID=1448309 RepID=A0A9P6ATT1_9AGAM|nr:hypothetical protein BS47DRAFT_1364382 [Hydnum rufescens UP504]
MNHTPTMGGVWFYRSQGTPTRPNLGMGTHDTRTMEPPDKPHLLKQGIFFGTGSPSKISGVRGSSPQEALGMEVWVNLKMAYGSPTMAWVWVQKYNVTFRDNEPLCHCSVAVRLVSIPGGENKGKHFYAEQPPQNHHRLMVHHTASLQARGVAGELKPSASTMPASPKATPSNPSSPIKLGASLASSSVPTAMDTGIGPLGGGVSEVTMLLKQMKLELASTQLEIAALRCEVTGLGRDVSGVWGDVGELHNLLTDDGIDICSSFSTAHAAIDGHTVISAHGEPAKVTAVPECHSLVFQDRSIQNECEAVGIVLEIQIHWNGNPIHSIHMHNMVKILKWLLKSTYFPPPGSSGGCGLIAFMKQVKQRGPGGLQEKVDLLGNAALHIPSDPSVPDFICNAFQSLQADSLQSSSPSGNPLGIDINMELEQLGFSTLFLETVGIPAAFSDLPIPPKITPANNIHKPPIIPKKPKSIDASTTCSSPLAALSAGPEHNECLLGFGNGGPACLDSALSQLVNSTSWSPITTLNNEGLNQIFTDEVPISTKQSKCIAATNWDSWMPFNAHLPACDGDKGCHTRTLKITCVHLKIDLDLLDFTLTVFKVEQPNIHGWDTLQQHFRKALQYYNILVSSMEEVVNNAVILARKQKQESTSLPNQVLSDHVTSAVPAVSDLEDHKPTVNNTRPSIYLQYHCPACFGGVKYPKDGRPCIFVASDGCTTQWQQQDRYDRQDYPLGLPIPQDLFVPTSETSAMSEYYTETKAAAKFASDKRPPTFDYHIRVSKEHVDKGLIVLYFMLTMIQKLLGELPESFMVGFFYDIICVMHHEMEHWQLLPQCLPHLKFATPVFHSYGHQWPCQLSYHPYKNPEFGCTDGPEKDAGVKAIEAVLNILKTQTSLQQQIMTTSNRQAAVALHDPSSPLCNEFLNQLDQLQTSLEKVELQLVKKESDLLLHGKMMRGDLDKIKSSQCLSTLPPAGISLEIQCMLANWDDAPQGTIPPKTLDRKGLFSLDVDGVIWKDKNMRVAIIAYLDLEGCQVKLDIIKQEVTNIHVWYAEEYNAIQAAIHEAETNSTLRFHLSHKLAALEEVGVTWDYSLHQLLYPAELQSIIQFASRTMPADTISVHMLSTLAHEDGPNSDSEDCMEEWNAAIPISEELRKIDKDKECSRSEGFPDDASKFK